MQPTIITAYLPVYNIPDYAYNYPFWAVRISDQNLWFYGAYSNLHKAASSAKSIGGIVLPVNPHPENK